MEPKDPYTGGMTTTFPRNSCWNL